MCIGNPSFDVEVIAFVDSQVEFAHRVSDLGLGEKMDSFVHSAKCFADLAFASDYIPHGPNSELFSPNLVAPVLGTGSRPLRPALRRPLFVEIYTLAAADLKRVDPGVEVDFVHKIRLGGALIDCFEGRGLEGVSVAKVGLLRTPAEHVQASGITHPLRTLSADNVKIAITKTLKMGLTAVEERWRSTLALRASKHEKGNYSSMQTGVARVLADKRLLLLALTSSGRCFLLALSRHSRGQRSV